ncbi:MAG: TTT type transport system small permease component [Rhodobacteraceae bacterium HLUCCA08]|nr:MAG: TTT type transport system small permease component [Rhodobacteraceae bacterium HLUCCA08]
MPLLRLIYVALMIGAVVFYLEAQQFPGPMSPRDIGPAVFPQWLAGMIVALCAAALLIEWRTMPRLPWVEIARPFGIGGAMVAAVWLATMFGFFVALPFALFGGLVLVGSRRWVANIAFSLLLPLTTWLIFERMLGLGLGTL